MVKTTSRGIKGFLFLFFSAFLPSLASAQLSIRDAFLQMPDSVAPYLSRENRLDLLDYLDAKMLPEVTNELQGRSRLVSLGVDSLVMDMSESLQMSLYIMESEAEADSSRQVIVLSRTYRLATGEQEHTLSFFSHRWRPLEQRPSLGTQASLRLRQESSTLWRRDEEVLKKEPYSLR
jgi:hypothetical protein